MLNFYKPKTLMKAKLSQTLNRNSKRPKPPLLLTLALLLYLAGPSLTVDAIVNDPSNTPNLDANPDLVLDVVALPGWAHVVVLSQERLYLRELDYST